MIQRMVLVVVVLLSLLAPAARADFASSVDLSPLVPLSVQHLQTLKTYDTYAREVLTTVTNRSTLDGKPASFIVLDMAQRPEAYVDRKLVYIRNKPFRVDFAKLDVVPGSDKERLIKEGTVSLAFWMSGPVQQAMNHVASTSTVKLGAINQISTAANQLALLLDAGRGRIGLPGVAFVPPRGAVGSNRDAWLMMADVAWASPVAHELVRAQGIRPASMPVVDLDPAAADELVKAELAVTLAWNRQDAAGVNKGLASFAAAVVKVNPAVYPSAAKRQTEVVYNRLTRLTLPGAALYFVAFVLFLIALRTGGRRLINAGIAFTLLGLLVHTVGIGVRWWLIEKSVGSWFYAIPIKNQFESVLFSAFFGVLVSMILVTYGTWGRLLPGFVARLLPLRVPGRAVFGAAGSFVGWLSLVAIFSAPYVTGREIGGDIHQVNGILMSYWLYIHVTMVTASYALIGMTFLMGCLWLVAYYMNYGTLARMSTPRALSADAAPGFEVLMPRVALAGMPAGMSVASGGGALARAAQEADDERVASGGTHFLATIDQCNLVMLQLAFWVLGVGIVLGAVWADMSWGRPWGWDPKETFALITWIVYLIVIHVRLVTRHKAYWTAVLSIVGFFVMLFNWVGVNFFLVGLHSYA